MQLDSSDVHSLGFYSGVQMTALVLGGAPPTKPVTEGCNPLQDSAAVASAASCLHG